jgi:pyruvate-formate lyase
MDRRAFILNSAKYSLAGVFIVGFPPLRLFAEGNDPFNYLHEPNVLPTGIGVNEEVKVLTDFTDAYKSTSDIAIREALCLRAQYKAWVCTFHDEDLFVGRKTASAIGFAPQAPDGFCYFISQGKLQSMLNDSKISPDNKLKLQKLSAFWKDKTTMNKTIDSFSSELFEALPTQDYPAHPNIAFPLYRIGGIHLDFDKLVRLGIPGLRKEIQKYSKKNASEESKSLYKGMDMTLDTLASICRYYAEMTENVKKKTTDTKRIKELDQIIASCRHISKEKPDTFHQAIQLCYLYGQFSGALNYGRMDVYLGDIYKDNITRGILTEEEAIGMIRSLFKIMSYPFTMDFRVIVGGRGRRNEENADEFALVVMESVRQNHISIPQFTLRFYKGQNPALYNKGLDMLAEGYVYPMLYNDDVNIPSVQNAFNVPYIDAMDYLPFGCGEYVINSKGIASPNGAINLLQALNVTLHNGIQPLNGQKMGLPLGKPKEFKTFEDLMKAYKKQVEYFVNHLAQQQDIEYKKAAEDAPLLMFSMLTDDCIARGQGILNGGARYLCGSLESYGNTNAADSLTAIKTIVYDKKIMTLPQLVEILDKNFEGYEKERRMMLDAPKYGNDNDAADDMLVEVDDHIASYCRNQTGKTSMHAYLVVVVNNHANVPMGEMTAASADGRLSKTFMANGNSPMGGRDINGVTSMLNSLVKPDSKIHAGYVQNMKFSKGLFAKNRTAVEALLATYWEKGGTQAMLTVVGSDDLENAMKNPEKYGNLIVRVGGYSARFVDLPPNIQREILSRTINDEM